MAFSLKGRHLLSLRDYSTQEIQHLIDLSAKLKALKYAGVFPKNLANKTIALIFEKPSTRTRCAFVVAAAEEGAWAEYLGKGDIQLGKKESVADTAKVLGRMFDGIQFRGFAHETVEELAANAGVPVWNGLTDRYHPTQILADFLTVQEKFGYLKGIRFAYVGDGRNNMANSLMVGAAKMGMDFRIVGPESLVPEQEIQDACQAFAKRSGGSITFTSDVAKGVAGAQVIYTDVWASMGEEDQIENRIAMLKPYQVNAAMMEATGEPECIFLHCLPAFHDQKTILAQTYPDICEVTDEVFSGDQSRAFDQAENRMHTIKAVMVATIGK